MTEYYYQSSSLSRNALAKAEDINSRTEDIASGFTKLPQPHASAPTTKGFSETFAIEDATGLTNPVAANQEQKQSLVYFADSGIADAMVVTMVPAPAAYTAGMKVVVKASAANTGATTINVNSLGAKSVVSPKSAALVANAIASDMVCQLFYDGTNFQLIGDTDAGTDKTVSDAAYGAGWDGDTNRASKNAIYDKIEILAPLASPTFTGTVAGVTKAMVGLTDVDDTADTAKPVSTAQQTALNLKANLAGPTFTGTVTVPGLTVGASNVIAGAGVMGVSATNQLQLEGSDISLVTASTSRMTVAAGGAVDVVGVLSKGSGSFKIDHPIAPDDKILYHSFIEGPRVDLIYRGTAKLIDGVAIIDLNTDSSVSGMIPGTFEALTQNAVVTSLHAQDSFSRVKSTLITGALFTITCEDLTSTDDVAWVVIAERADAFIKSIDITDDEGHLIPEIAKEEATSEELKVLEPEIIEVAETQDDEIVKVTSLSQKKGYRIHYKAFGVEQPTRLKKFEKKRRV